MGYNHKRKEKRTLNLSEEEFLYISSRTPLINIDLFLVNEDGELLLSWRDDEYCGTGWHIPGGVVRHGERMIDRVEKTAIRELGFVPKHETSPCKITEIFLEQAFRNHSVSLLFKCWCNKSDVRAVEENERHNLGDLCWLDHNPWLVYSQTPYEEYLNEYFYTLQEKKRVGKQGNADESL